MDELRLHAYADGQLPPEEADQVLAWLARHPEAAVRVLGWQAQRAQLRALQVQVLDEPVPPALVQAWAEARRGPAQPRPVWLALAAALLLAAGLAAGLAWRGLGGETATQFAGRTVVPSFVRDAAVAHVVYTPERRHPVEVGAAEHDHLVQWLSKRLGTPLRVPVLTEQGYALVGGRLLPGSGTEADAPASARAQFMYEDATGHRLTLYVSVFAQDHAVPTGFQLAGPTPGSSTRSFYWLDGRQGYALSGELPAEQLAQLARSVYRQLTP
ncbi:MAG: anti-sigma factor [Burkholderiales bacterium]